MLAKAGDQRTLRALIARRVKTPWLRGGMHRRDAGKLMIHRTEGRARAAYLSAVRRALSTSAIVIADGGAGLNIKGSRYELWCAARELGLRCATVRTRNYS